MADKIVKLKDGNDYLYPLSIIDGIDTSNVLSTFSTGWITSTYTATEDCYIVGDIANGTGITIDGVQVIKVGASSICSLILPIRKSQVIYLNVYTTNKLAIYGVKQ